MKFLFLISLLGVSLSTYASTWTYSESYDDVTQTTMKMATAKSDNIKTVAGKSPSSNGSIILSNYDGIYAAMVSTYNDLDICIDGCYMPIRFDDESFTAILSGDGGSVNIINNIMNEDFNKFDGFEFVANKLAETENLAISPPSFSAPSASYYFNFEAPVDLSRVFDEDKLTD